MDHKKALLKILKWAGSFLISTLFSAPIIIVLLIGGMVMALFGKSSKSSLQTRFRLARPQHLSVSIFQRQDIPTSRLQQFWEIWSGNLGWITIHIRN